MLLIITRFRILSVIVVAQQISVLWKQKKITYRFALLRSLLASSRRLFEPLWDKEKEEKHHT